LNKLGSVISSAIQLGLNAHGSEKGSISPKTYLVLVALQCLGLPLALLISPPEKLIREDGKKPTFGTKKVTWKGQAKAFGKLFKRKEIVLLLPIFITEQWGQTYNGTYYPTYPKSSRGIANDV
jgi:hypothetical protein